jgi:hypothetical protein
MIYNCAVPYCLRETSDSNNEEYTADQEYAETSYRIFVRREGQIDFSHTLIQSELMLSPFIYKFTMVFILFTCTPLGHLGPIGCFYCST